MLLQLILGDSAAKTKVTPGHNDTLLQIVDCRIWVSNSYAICSKAKQQSSKALQLQKLNKEINQKRQ